VRAGLPLTFKVLATLYAIPLLVNVAFGVGRAATFVSEGANPNEYSSIPWINDPSKAGPPA